LGGRGGDIEQEKRRKKRGKKWWQFWKRKTAPPKPWTPPAQTAAQSFKNFTTCAWIARLQGAAVARSAGLDELGVSHLAMADCFDGGNIVRCIMKHQCGIWICRTKAPFVILLKSLPKVR
jgi:hypothetical protein